jgi:hypothetical protein
MTDEIRKLKIKKKHLKINLHHIIVSSNAVSSGHRMLILIFQIGDKSQILQVKICTLFETMKKNLKHHKHMTVQGTNPSHSLLTSEERNKK